MTSQKKMKVIGRGTWIDKLAYELIEREKSLGIDIKSKDTIIVESGLGASGIPHIGSLGDAVRAYGVKLALEDMGYKAELIAYSDDLDGLRKIPEGFSVDLLKEHIAKPVSLIPDPFSCHESYGMHMSSLLLDGLDRLDIKYKFQRAKDTYEQGLLKDQINTILINRDKIGQKISEMVGQNKFQKYLPYFPVCANCNRLYTADAIEYISDERKVRYKCHDTEIGSQIVNGCGYEGESDVTKDLGKLAWKVEFAARWQAFNVRFEAYGKDIMDSVKVNDWVTDNILEYPHPYHVKYEMFLDKGGKKISKSLGNVLTSQKWLKYGSPKSIMLLLYKRITGAREVGFDDIPLLMDEYNELEDIYFKRVKVDNEAKYIKLKGLYEYVNKLNPPKEMGNHISYRLLIELSKIFKENRMERIIKKLIEYGIIKESNSNVEYLIKIAGNYADDFDLQEKVEISIDDKTKKALKELVEALRVENDGDKEDQDIQNMIYQTAKSNEIMPKEFFTTLYQIILNTTRGPKIGPLITDIGREKVSKIIQGYIE